LNTTISSTSAGATTECRKNHIFSTTGQVINNSVVLGFYQMWGNIVRTHLQLDLIRLNSSHKSYSQSLKDGVFLFHYLFTTSISIPIPTSRQKWRLEDKIGIRNRYCISYLDALAIQILHAIRSPWSIEKQPHGRHHKFIEYIAGSKKSTITNFYR